MPILALLPISFNYEKPRVTPLFSSENRMFSVIAELLQYYADAWCKRDLFAVNEITRTKNKK